MKYPDLLFDADDTLFDFPKAARRAFDALCAAYEIPNTPETRQLYHQINLELWSAFERQEITKDQVVHDRFVRFLGALRLDLDPDLCNTTYLRALGQSSDPLPHAEEVCRELVRRGHRLFLITNAVASVQRSRLQSCSFRDCFTAAFISEEAGAAKPDQAYYDYVFTQIPDLVPERCLAIGDSLTTDIRGANNAGLPCCWFNPKGKAADPALRIDYEIHTLPELLSIV